MKTNKMHIMSMALIAALGFSGCSHVAGSQVLAKQKKHEIVVGQTTKEEIFKLYGEPLYVDTIIGSETWTYAHWKRDPNILTYIPIVNVIGGYTGTDNSLVVIFSKHGTVQKYVVIKQSIKGEVISSGVDL